MKKTFFYFISVFLAGFVILCLEVLGYRLLAPEFGYSIYVFGSLIGVIMLALSCGHVLGGIAGDKGLRWPLAGGILSCAALYLLLISSVYPNVLAWCGSFGIRTGSLLATITLFALPLILLAAVSPYCIKLFAGEQRERVGISAGSLYAVATLGSLAGTFATAFYLIPELGTHRTLQIAVLFVFLIAALFLIRSHAALAIIFFVPLVGIWFITPPALGASVLEQVDSPYNTIEVVDYGDFFGIRTNRRTATVHSYYPKPGSSRHFLLYDLFSVAPLISGARQTLLLGLGAGTLPRLHQEFGQRLQITGVELDPYITAVGHERFQLDDVKNLRIVHEDARSFLAHDRQSYGLIEIDLFQGNSEIPFYVATQEFFKLTKARLIANGVIAMNIYDPSSEKVILGPLANTIASVYPHLLVADAGSGSFFVIASLGPLPIDRARITESMPLSFQRAVQHFNQSAQQIVFDSSAPVFTDDRAPLEQLSYEALLKDR